MNETKTTACGCANCPGSACTCGCQQVSAKAARACGSQCNCGEACRCGQQGASREA